LIVTALLAGVAVSFAAETERLSDREIADAVEDELRLDAAVPHHRIDVATTDGVVTLTGVVTNITAGKRAVDVASIVRGVRSVIDLIRVMPLWDVSDETIQANVRDALRRDSATEDWQIDAVVEDGTVTLAGVVDSWQEGRLAEKVAGNVRGVREVVNRLAVVSAGERSDAELQLEITSLMRWEARLARSAIVVSVSQGGVALSGTVCSLGEKNLAGKVAWVRGVTHVDASAVEVMACPQEPQTRPPATPPPPDDRIAEAVRDALRHDPRVVSFDVEVDVVKGEVMLRGRVDDLRARRAATQDARNTTGVTSVVNRIKLRSDLFLPSILLPDDELEQRVAEGFEQDPLIERHEIEVEAIDGTIYLRGSVDTFLDKARADDLASKILGVVEVRNHLVVEDPLIVWHSEPILDDFPVVDYDWYRPRLPDTIKSDDQIRRAIEHQLWWSTQVNSDDVTVVVDDGVATLTGSVGSWHERSAATKNAYDGGAILVRNRLSIEW
jgi:osmotically-inducible protein OsmY